MANMVKPNVAANVRQLLCTLILFNHFVDHGKDALGSCFHAGRCTVERSEMAYGSKQKQQS